MIVAISRIIFWLFIVKPLVFIGLGLNIINKKGLPFDGPSILAPNHNSHLDTIVLMSLYPLSDIQKIHPIAAADYFLKNKWIAWFSLHIIGIVPLDRSGIHSIESLFNECEKILEKNEVLILFPEGSRGNPEKMVALKKGIYHLAQKIPHTNIVPIFMRGLGKSLPKGEALLVPFNCDIIIGQPIKQFESSSQLLIELKSTYKDLSTQCLTKTEDTI